MPRMSRGGEPRRSFRLLSLASLLAGAVLWSGCSEDGNSTFMEIEPRSTAVAVFDDQIMEGGDQLSFPFDISADMGHPEVRGTWTVINREVFIDMYVFAAADYDPNLPPTEQNYFWSSVPEEGPEFGERRGTQIILHPCTYDTGNPPVCRAPGSWVVVFYSDNLRTPANRTSISATVSLRFFQ